MELLKTLFSALLISGAVLQASTENKSSGIDKPTQNILNMLRHSAALVTHNKLHELYDKLMNAIDRGRMIFIPFSYPNIKTFLSSNPDKIIDWKTQKYFYSIYAIHMDCFPRAIYARFSAKKENDNIKICSGIIGASTYWSWAIDETNPSREVVRKKILEKEFGVSLDDYWNNPGKMLKLDSYTNCEYIPEAENFYCETTLPLKQFMKHMKSDQIPDFMKSK